MWTELGYPTFINFGGNRAGAPDDVYTLTHDQPDACEAADAFVLMRVPKDAIADRSVYEFFTCFDEGGTLLWTSAIDQRDPVFTFPGRCRRSGMSYEAGTGRYLGCSGTSGFGVYDAPIRGTVDHRVLHREPGHGAGRTWPRPPP